MRLGNLTDEPVGRTKDLLRSNLFVNCTAGENGGAIVNTGWDSSTVLCVFVSCTSKTGAVYAGNQPVHYNFCDFCGNGTDLYYNPNYSHSIEERNTSHDLSVNLRLEGNGTESEPYLLKTASDIAFLAAKCAGNDKNYSCACYKLANGIDNIYTPVKNFDGILYPNGKVLRTRFTGELFEGNFGCIGTVNTADLFGKSGVVYERSNYRFLESDHGYNVGIDETKEYRRPGATSIEFTFSPESSLRYGYRDYIYVYDGNGREIAQFTGSQPADKKVTVSGDTVKIRITASSATDYQNNPNSGSFGYRVEKLNANYASNGAGSALSGGSIAVIVTVALAAIAGIATAVIVGRKKIRNS